MKIRRVFLLLYIILGSGNILIASNEVRVIPAWIFFTEKNTISFSPEQYFVPLALERKVAAGLAPYDYQDLPVDSENLRIIESYTIEIAGTSRWLNAALVLATEEQISRLVMLDFVKSVTYSSVSTTILAGKFEKDLNKDSEKLLKKQLSMHESEILSQNNLNGKGIRIAVFDGGFPGVDTHPAFEHLRKNNQIIATWDFAKKSPEVYKFNNHGTAVLSCIAGISENGPSGMATGSEYLLARTELAGEPWREELYWIQAAEWADQMGAHIISSSLGYTYHRYFKQDLTGVDTPVAKAANIAARKGILVINCIGNEGDNDWKYAITPADSDSVLSVGGVDPSTGIHISFSSFGPNMSGKMKPNVVSTGKVIAATRDGWDTSYGTSFSTPLIAGFAACSWQLNPKLNNMEIFRLVEESGHLYPYFDYAHGFGIPKASNLFKQQQIKDNSNSENFSVTSKPGLISIETGGDQNGISGPRYLYYNLRDDKGNIIRYGVYQYKTGQSIFIDINENESVSSCYLRTKKTFQVFKL